MWRAPGLIHVLYFTLRLQVTAQFLIAADQAPYYDFELAFEATIPPLSTATFRVSPSADGTCGGGDVSTHKRRGWAPLLSIDKKLLAGLADADLYELSIAC